MRPSAPIHALKRRARLLARARNLPLHAALDQVARDEGFAAWSLLMRRLAAVAGHRPLLDELAEGELVLLAARPGEGKTKLALRLLLEAAGADRRAVFFTLVYGESEARARLMAEAGEGRDRAERVEVETSDGICAASIIGHLGEASRGTVAVVDYLQVLDQRRETPPLGEQIADLHGFAARSGATIAFISQVDRDQDRDALPGIQDIRLPNPVDLGLFARACFLQGGRIGVVARERREAAG